MKDNNPLFDKDGTSLRKPTDEEYQKDPFYWDSIDDSIISDEPIYLDEGIEIHSETFHQDFDDVGFDPEVIDDSDSDAADFFDYR